MRAKKKPPKNKIAAWLKKVPSYFWGVLGAVGLIGTFLALFFGLNQGYEVAKMRRELGELKKQVSDFQLYLDPLYKTTDPAFAKIISKGVEAIRKYKYGEAIGYFRSAIELTSDTATKLSLLNIVGLSQYKNGTTSNAEQTFLEMITVAEQAKNDEALAAALGNIASAYCTLGKPRKALEYLKKSLEIEMKIGNLEGQTINLSDIGVVYSTLGEPQDALDYFERALKIAERIGNPEIQASILSNIGAAYCNMGNNQKGLAYFLHSREIFVRIGAKDKIATCDHNIAIARQKLAGQEK